MCGSLLGGAPKITAAPRITAAPDPGGVQRAGQLERARRASAQGAAADVLTGSFASAPTGGAVKTLMGA